MTINFTDLTTSQLNRIIAIKERIEKLQGRIGALGEDQRGGGFQASQEGQTTIKRGWEGGDYRWHQSQMGQSEGSQKEG
ncbi:MAG: hypothetical protein ABSG59_06155 [Verrucomicrobiota bacterium]